MLPENNEKDMLERETGQREFWHRTYRCSICTNFLLFSSIFLSEPVDAPEPHQEWTLCKACHEALLVEMHKSAIRSPIRLRIAVGFVAAERSPKAYSANSKTREQQAFDREFAWFVWAIVLFGLLHAVIFAILIALPK